MEVGFPHPPQPHESRTLTVSSALLIQAAGFLFTVGLVWGVYRQEMSSLQDRMAAHEKADEELKISMNAVLRKLDSMGVQVDNLYRESVHQRNLIEKEVLNQKGSK